MVRQNGDPFESLSAAEFDELAADFARKLKAHKAREVYGINRALASMPEPEEPYSLNDLAALLQNTKAGRENTAKLVAEAVENNHKMRKKGKRLPRKILKFSKRQIASFRIGGLTEVQEEYLSLKIEYGLRASAIARIFGIHPSTVQESLKTAYRKMDRIQNNPRIKRFSRPLGKI